jgi:hypothetical protein
MVVPNSNVCPGWGNITITPALSTTAWTQATQIFMAKAETPVEAKVVKRRKKKTI